MNEMAGKIPRETEWQPRWDGFVGCMLGVENFAQQQLGLAPQEVTPELSGVLAGRIVDTLGAPPLIDPGQSLLYLCSEEAEHRAAAQA